jgi:hypothetical protein
MSKRLIRILFISLMLCLPQRIQLYAQETCGSYQIVSFGLTGSKFWDNGSTLNVHFLDGERAFMERVAEIASEWTGHANLHFRFFFDPNQPPNPAHIRVTFTGQGEYWSAVGKDSHDVGFFPKQSMRLARLWELDDTETRRIVLHEFGHAIGLHHEHQNPAAGIPWNEEAVFRYFRERYQPPWDEAKVRRNILNPLNGNLVNYTAFDPDSIMLYAFPQEWTLDGFSAKWNNELSAGDKAGIAQFYPGADKQTLQMLIDVASDGATVRLTQENYDGADVLDFKGKTLTFVSDDGVNVTIKVSKLLNTKGIVTFKAGRNSTITLISPAGAVTQMRNIAIVADEQGAPQFVTEFQPSDVNGDGIVDLADLTAVARHFGKSPTQNLRADVNRDGTVNIFDLTLVAQHVDLSTATASAGMTAR